MNNRDLHQALKTEVLGQSRSANASCVLVKLQWGKNDMGFSLHVSPYTFSTYGFQVTDFLSHLGFQRSGCSFSENRECYSRLVDKDFDIDAFANLFDQSFQNLTESQKDLEQCGFFIGRSYGHGLQMSGDGHTAMSMKSMKQSEDEYFKFRFTWLESDYGKGWVIHYLPKHQPLSSEFQSVFQFLGLSHFEQCPEYDFEPCHWRSIALRSSGDGSFDNNADTAHKWFDAHAQHFSPGLHKLLTANAEIEECGLSFLPFQQTDIRLDADIEKRTARPTPESSKPDLSHFDVAISFAGTEREYAEKLATIVKRSGFSVFYDDFHPEHLWGKNLVDTFDEIFRKRARYCVIFISKEYNDRMWTNHERQSAQARALSEKGKEYILPIKVDDSELDGMPSTIGYVGLDLGIDKISELLIKKINS
jgi:hypothetical protein